VRAAAALLLLAAAVPAPAPPEGEPGPRWIEGPVRYLLSAEEERAARALRSPEEYREFVDRFWLRHDPTPDTPVNEFRNEFMRRVDAAGRQFGETTKPGWKTDRGKIYILLGPPSEISSSPSAPDRRGIIAWVYRNAPQVELGPEVVVRFAEDSSGEYHLTADAFVDSRVVRSSARALFPGQIPGPPVLGEDSELARRATQSRLQDVPRKVSAPSVAVSWSVYGNPFRSCESYYLSQDGSTLAALSFEVEPEFLREDPAFRPQDVRALGHLARLGGPEHIDLERLPALEPFPEQGSSRPFQFQTLRPLVPGRYRAYYALVDVRDHLRGSYHADLEVPSLAGEGLVLSSLTLVEELREAAPAEAEPRLKPFVIGHLRVVPRCRSLFAAGEELGLYYQIYDRRRSAAGEPPPLDIEYRFDLLLDGKRYAVGAPLRLAGQISRVQGQTFSLEGWPRGEYRMSLVVSDPADGTRAGGEAAFEIR
jgi:GWxTD domain-containing protein